MFLRAGSPLSRQQHHDLAVQCQERLQVVRHLKMEESGVHEEVETRGTLARSEKSVSEVQGCDF